MAAKAAATVVEAKVEAMAAVVMAVEKAVARVAAKAAGQGVAMGEAVKAVPSSGSRRPPTGRCRCRGNYRACFRTSLPRGSC